MPLPLSVSLSLSPLHRTMQTFSGDFPKTFSLYPIFKMLKLQVTSSKSFPVFASSIYASQVFLDVALCTVESDSGVSDYTYSFFFLKNKYVARSNFFNSQMFIKILLHRISTINVLLDIFNKIVYFSYSQMNSYIWTMLHYERICFQLNTNYD